METLLGGASPGVSGFQGGFRPNRTTNGKWIPANPLAHSGTGELLSAVWGEPRLLDGHTVVRCGPQATQRLVNVELYMVWIARSSCGTYLNRHEDLGYLPTTATKPGKSSVLSSWRDTLFAVKLRDTTNGPDCTTPPAQG
ncbi:MAG: hypothetical protein WB661_12570 [Candidatus Bathyarchaeia archaeon]